MDNDDGPRRRAQPQEGSSSKSAAGTSAAAAAPQDVISLNDAPFAVVMLVMMLLGMMRWVMSPCTC